MKKLLLIQITIFISAFSFAKIEVLDRIAIIVDDGVVMESQIIDLLETTKLRSLEQGIQLPATDELIDEIQEQLIIQELQLQRGRDFGIRISDGELNQTFIQIAANNGVSLEEFIENYEDSGQSYEKLREEIRRDMIIQRVQRGMVGGTINITAQEIAGFLATEEAIAQLTPELLIRQIQVNSFEEAQAIIFKINVGESFESDPTVTIDSPPALPFNANSGITNADDTIAFSTAAHAGFLQVGDRVTYLVAAGNTALTNLANGTTYFISHANSTTVALSATSGGANIDLTKGVTEAGHTLTGETATATTKIGGGGQGFITARAAGTLNLTNVYGSFVSGLRIKGTTSGVTGNVHSVRTSEKSTSNASTFDQRLRLTGFSNQTSGAFTIDEQIKQEQTSANAVLHHINTDSVAAITNVKGNFMASDSTQTIEVEGVSSGQRFKFTGKAGPDLVENSGEIMYVENIPPITRDDSQTESIKLMIKF